MDQPLKAIFWNIWGHRHPEQIHTFLNEHSDADIICLTEVTHVENVGLPFRDTNLCYSDDPNEPPSQVDGYTQLTRWSGDSYTLRYDSATYAPWTCKLRNIRFDEVGFGSVLGGKSLIYGGAEIISFSEYPEFKSRVLQWGICETQDCRYLIAHIHGVWIPTNTKGDHDARLHQSCEIRRHLQSIAQQFQVDKVVFGGDLNLDITTEALRVLESGVHPSDAVYRNLVKEHKITNTRTKSYRKMGLPGLSMFADYVLVNETVDVHSFEVYNHIDASDHAPLVVTFS
jgi:exonuclease III